MQTVASAGNCHPAKTAGARQCGRSNCSDALSLGDQCSTAVPLWSSHLARMPTFRRRHAVERLTPSLSPPAAQRHHLALQKITLHPASHAGEGSAGTAVVSAGNPCPEDPSGSIPTLPGEFPGSTKVQEDGSQQKQHECTCGVRGAAVAPWGVWPDGCCRGGALAGVQGRSYYMGGGGGGGGAMPGGGGGVRLGG